MQNFDGWIDRYRRRLQVGKFLQRAGEWLAGFLFLFGGLVLVSKLAVPHLWPDVLWVGLLAIPAASAAWWIAARRPYSREQSVAMLDQRLQAGGLLMTLAEREDPRWREHLPQSDSRWEESLPRFRPVRLARLVVVPLLFAVAACFVPVRTAHTQPVLKGTVGREAVAELEEMLEAIEETLVLEEQEQQELEQEIAALAEETEHRPLSSEKWEAVDALRQRLRIEANEAAAQASQAMEAARTLESLLKESQSSERPLSEEEIAELEEDVVEMLRKLSKMDQTKLTAGLSQPQKDRLQRLIKRAQQTQGNRLPKDPQARQELLDDLQNFLDDEWKEMQQACQQCQGGQPCPSCGKGDCPVGGNGECEGGTSPSENGGKPGQGGITRGPGAAEMLYGEESDEQAAKFLETVLPPGFEEDPKDEVLEIRRAEPEVDVAATAARTEAREAGPSAGNETWNRRLRPRHRDVVRNYFDGE